MAIISIIVPVYNTEKYLQRCLDSILAQAFGDFKLIIIDDGSTDKSGIICDEYQKRDKRIIVIHQANQGQSVARNKALEWILINTNSRFVTFIDSDDWVHPNYLEHLYRAIEKYSVKISQCLFYETDNNKHISSKPIVENCIAVSPEEAYINWYSAPFWGKLYAVDIFYGIRFPEGQIYEDVAIWYKVLFSQSKISIINEQLYYYFINHESTVRQQWTPKRLAQVEAWENQIAFFSKMGNKTVLQCAATRQMQVLLGQFSLVKQSNGITPEEKEKYKKLLIKKIQKAYIRFHNNDFIASKKELIRSIAFPIWDYIYWTLRGIKSKIKRTFND